MVWLLAAVLTSNVTFASGTEDINDESVAYQSIETNLSEEKQLLDVDSVEELNFTPNLKYPTNFKPTFGETSAPELNYLSDVKLGTAMNPAPGDYLVRVHVKKDGTISWERVKMNYTAKK